MCKKDKAIRRTLTEANKWYYNMKRKGGVSCEREKYVR